MEINITKLPKSQVELEITVPESEMIVSLDKAAEKISKNKKIKGFRPGKAPRSIIEKEVGKMTVLQEALDDIVNKNLTEAIRKEKLDLIASPEVSFSQVAPDNPLKFKAKVTVLPDIEIGKYKDLRFNGEPLKIEEVKIEEKDIKESFDYLQKNRAVLKEVDRSAQKGDFVEIDFEGKIDGVNFEGGQSKNHPLVLGEGKFINGFEDNVVGMKKDDEKEFELSFPENYHEKKIAGKKASFKVKMREIKERIMPEVNDEFAKEIGKFENLNALKESITEGIRKEKLEREKEKIRIKILDEIVKDSKMELPDALIDSELKKMEMELEDGVKRTGMNIEDYLKQIKKTKEDLRSEWWPQAEKRVKVSIILMKIAEREKIEVSDNEVKEKASKALSSFGQMEKIGGQINPERFYQYMKQTLLNEKTLALLEKFNIKK